MQETSSSTPFLPSSFPPIFTFSFVAFSQVWGYSFQIIPSAQSSKVNKNAVPLIPRALTRLLEADRSLSPRLTTCIHVEQKEFAPCWSKLNSLKSPRNMQAFLRHSSGSHFPGFRNQPRQLTFWRDSFRDTKPSLGGFVRRIWRKQNGWRLDINWNCKIGWFNDIGCINR